MPFGLVHSSPLSSNTMVLPAHLSKLAGRFIRHELQNRLKRRRKSVNFPHSFVGKVIGFGRLLNSRSLFLRIYLRCGARAELPPPLPERTYTTGRRSPAAKCLGDIKRSALPTDWLLLVNLVHDSLNCASDPLLRRIGLRQAGTHRAEVTIRSRFHAHTGCREWTGQSFEPEWERPTQRKERDPG